MNQAAPSHQVRVEPSGRVFAASADDTLLASALRQGVMLPHQCGDGACGHCKIRCLAGHVAHPAGAALAILPEERAQGLILACQARARSDLVLHSERVGQEAAFAVREVPARVLSLVRLAPDVMRLGLQHAGEPLGFHAGQHLRLSLRDGTTRAYSLAHAPVTEQGVSRELELHIRHMPAGRFSGQVFGSMKVRDMLRVSGPWGGFRLNEPSGKPIVFLASGTGFAPIKAMLEHMRWRGIQRPAHLYWGGRRRADLYLMDWVREQAQAWPWLDFHPVLSEATPQDAWTGRTGLVHRAVLEDFADLSGHEVYACGAPPMVEAARRDFAGQARLPPASFFADAFVPSASGAASLSLSPDG